LSISSAAGTTSECRHFFSNGVFQGVFGAALAVAVHCHLYYAELFELVESNSGIFSETDVDSTPLPSM
jgi:hypothetical protein